MRVSVLCCFLFLLAQAQAQVDTLNPTLQKLNVKALKEGKATYAVFFEDSLGNRLGSADLWDRSLQFSTDATGQAVYTFDWKWWRRDSLLMSVQATGLLSSLTPLTHNTVHAQRGQAAYRFDSNLVTVPATAQRTARDSAFRVALSPPAYSFPMDLETFPLLPFKKAGQKFAIAFYEPGSPRSAYYSLTVTGKEDLSLPGAQSVACWLLRIDYAPGSYATFWISDKTREVLKMKEYFRGRYRYKVRLY